MRRLVSAVLSLFGFAAEPHTPERVKSEVAQRMQEQDRKVKELIRADYQRQDQRMAGRR